MVDFILMLVFLTPAQPPGQNPASVKTCDAIDKVDFMNSELNFESNSLRFRDGKACTTDSGDVNACDWQHTVTLDKVITPEPGKAVRLIIINSNHLTGSGAWDHVLLFECRDGKVSHLFNESYLYGVKVDKLEMTEFVLVSSDRLKKDPECCPSRHKREVFRWDPKKGVFTLSEQRVR